MRRLAWMIWALLLMGLGMMVSGPSGAAKPVQETQQPKTAAPQENAGKETATPAPGPNPDAEGVYHAGAGVTPAHVIYSVDPEFSDKARKKKLGGTCVIGMVVDTRGTPQDVRVVQSLAEGVAPKLRSAAQSLDVKAVEAAKRYKFKPAMYQGKLYRTSSRSRSISGSIDSAA
jgi:TonB family protein